MRAGLVVAPAACVLGLASTCGPRTGRAWPVVAVRAGTFDLALRLEGTIQPEKARLLSVPSDLSDVRIEHLVDDGTRVRTGELVVRLAAYEKVIEEREARRGIAEKEQELAQEGHQGHLAAADEGLAIAQKMAERDLAQTLLDLTGSTPTSAPTTAGPGDRLPTREGHVQASLDLRRKKAHVEAAALDERLVHTRELGRRGYAASLEVDEVGTELAKARIDARRQANQLALRKEGAPAQVRARAELALARAQRELSLAIQAHSRQDRLRTLARDKKQAEIADKRAAHKSARDRLAALELRAPQGGVALHVRSRWREPLGVGAVVYGSDPLVRIAGEDAFEVDAAVDERHVHRVRAGQRAQVFPGGLGRGLWGTVRSVAKVATARDAGDPEGARQFAVVIAVDPRQSPRPRPNSTALVEVAIGRVAGVARVARELVRGQGAKAHVWLVRGGRAERRPVAAVDSDADFAYVRGLADTDEVSVLAPDEMP